MRHARPVAIQHGVFLVTTGNSQLNTTASDREPMRSGEGCYLSSCLSRLCALWELIVYLGDYPAFFLPTPRLVWARGVAAVRDGSLPMHTWVTLREVFAGLVAGLSVAIVLGYLLAKSRTVERLIAPYLAASQAIPIVALAPLLVIWFGPGSLSKVLVCALTLFFPVLINTIVGIRSVDSELVELLRSLQATRWQTLRVP